MAFGELVKSLVVRFTSENYEVVKEEINSIPDKKEVKVTFDTSALGLAIKDLGAKIEQALGGGAGGGGNDFWSRLLFKGFGGINLPGPMGSLPAFLTSLPGLAVLAAALGAAASELTAVAGGFAAAGAGAVAFGLLAKPTFTAVSTALTNIATDTAAYQAATTAAAKSTALAKIKADWAALDPAQKEAVKQVQKFQDAWAAAAQAFEPQAMKIFNDVLNLANNILPALSPLATAFSNALDPLLKKLDGFVQSKGFKDWLKAFTNLIGPATGAIGSGIGRFVNDVGKLLTTFSGKDVAHGINMLFDTVDAVVRAITWVVNTSRTAWDWISQKAVPALVHAWDNVSHAIDNVHHAFDNIGHFITSVFDAVVHAIGNVMHAIGNFNHAIDNVRHFIAVLGQDIARFFTQDIPHWIGIGVNWFKGLPGRIISAVGNLGHLLFSAGASIIHGLIAGISSALGGLISIMSHVAGIIGGFLPNSPEAKVGPLSGYGGLVNRGHSISEFLAKGITEGGSAVNVAMLGITRGIAGPHGVGVRTGGGAGGITLNVTVSPGTSPNETARAIQKMLLQLKRNNGGAALGLA